MGPREILFGNGQRAALIEATDDAIGDLNSIGLSPGASTAVLVVCGGADELAGPALARTDALVGRAVRMATAVTGAIVVDGGTGAGVMGVTGRARANHESDMPVLLGVAPAGEVTAPDDMTEKKARLEDHHTHFVLADSDTWGGETELLFELVALLAGTAPVVMLIAGGGEITKTEAVEAVRHGWPLVVVTSTGGVADAVAGLAGDVRRAAGTTEPYLQEIVRDGTIRVFTGNEPSQLGRELAWDLQDAPTLKSAWRAFATFDRLASRLRRTFELLQLSILGLGIVATLLALLHQSFGGAVLHWAVVVAPIIAAGLVAFANRRASGQRWVRLRSAAEEIKSEIFLYRTCAGRYRDAPSSEMPAMLADALDTVESRLMHTEAINGRLTPYDGVFPPPMYGAGEDDDGLSKLTAQRYLAIRVADQLRYYQARVRGLDRRRLVLQALALTAGGAGTVLAAAGFEIWIGLTAVISSAALAVAAYLQIDSTISGYNQSAGRLDGLVRAWEARPPQERGEQSAFAALVTSCEDVFVAELGGWVQQMTTALEELRERQEDAARTGENSLGRQARAGQPRRVPDD